MAFTKIQDSDLNDIGVIGLPDKPGLSTAAMQAKFEETSRSVVIPKHNGLIDELEAPTASSNIGIQAPEGLTGNTVQGVVDNIAYQLDQLDPASVAHKADKVTGATNGNLAGLDSNGNLTDSGHSYSDITTALSSKVDKIDGKGLSTNDYDNTAKGIVDGVTSALSGKVDKNGSDSLMTADEHTKLSGIASGAEVNVQSDWNQSDSSADDYIKNKPSFTQVQSDWNQSTNTEPDYIKNKPTLGTASTLDVPVSGNASTSQVVKGDDSRLTDSRNAADVYSWAKAATKPSYSASEVGAIPSTDKGANGGVAELDSSGKVPSSQLPSYVDDVLEYNSLSDFPATGETGKIYIAKDTNKTYRWSGTAYVEISESLALGETSSTAYAGNKGKANADAINAIKDGTTIDSFGDVESALSDKQPKTLATAITVDGTQETTVEGALGAINTLAAGNKTAIGNIKDGTTIDSFADVETALAGKQATLTFDNVPTASSNNPVKSSGVYDSISATQTLIDDTVGWTGKNKLPITISDLKSANKGGTWTGNTYVYNGLTYTFDITTNGYVSKVNINGLTSARADLFLMSFDRIKATFLSYIGEQLTISGCPEGGEVSNGYWVNAQGLETDGIGAMDTGSGASFTVRDFSNYNTVAIKISVAQGVTITNKVFSPMISDAEEYKLSPTYEPYHASVEDSKADNSVIAPVENGTTTSQAYAVGSHAIRNGAFITWKNAKAQGETIADSDYDSGDVADELNAKSYSTTGLTFTNCSLVAGGYVKIGNLCVVNMRVLSDSSGNSMQISGFPAYTNKTTSNKVIVICNVLNTSQDSDVNYYSQINSLGGCTIKGSSGIVSEKEYSISATYLCD